MVAVKAIIGTVSELNVGQPAIRSDIEKEPNDRGFGR